MDQLAPASPAFSTGPARAYTPATLVKVDPNTSDIHIDLGQALWPTLGIITVLCLFVLLLTGKIRLTKVKGPLGSEASFEAEGPKLADTQVSDTVGLECTPDKRLCFVHEDIDEGVDSLLFGKMRTEKHIMSSQIRSIRDWSDQFEEVYRDADPRDVGALWTRFKDELYVAAVENHILSHIDSNGRIEQDYLQDKLLPIHQGHRLLAKKYELPQWEMVEMGIHLLMRMALDEYARIASEEWTNFKINVDAVLKTVSGRHPAIEKRLSRLIEDL